MTAGVLRKTGGWLAAGLVSVGLIAWHLTRHEPWRDPHTFHGWMLAVLVFFLASYNLRKKLSFLPLGSSALWLRLHVYAGLVGIVSFSLHTGLRMPTGTFDTLLSLLFVLVTLSGVGGLLVSRTIPRRLARRGEEVIYERIPRFVRLLAAEAHEVAVGSVARTRSRALVDYYQAHLRPFLARPCETWSHILGFRGAAQRRAHAMDEFRTLIGPDEEVILDELQAIVRQKEDLDFHFANQGLLKHWFFLHIPLTYALVMFAVVHAVLVYAFGGGR